VVRHVLRLPGMSTLLGIAMFVIDRERNGRSPRGVLDATLAPTAGGRYVFGTCCIGVVL
jgi:hypothetical protein